MSETNGTRTGARLRCPVCGSEAIVVKAGDAELRCCGAELEPAGGPGAARPS